jgi:hypothetical protein
MKSILIRPNGEPTRPLAKRTYGEQPSVDTVGVCW